MVDKIHPTIIGNYKIKRHIATGGMGEVFLAWDNVCLRPVALKCIKPGLKHSSAVHNRFLREAHIAAKLNHPSIIPIYAIYEEKEQSYYTMPYIDGENLKQILRATRKSESQGDLHPIGSSIPALMRIFLSICQAVSYCHSQKILHRDLKPENILIGKYGEVLILDWGLAYIFNSKEPKIDESLPESKGLTNPGKILGTLSYMPPERILGVKPSVQFDIYALGVILYQMLTLEMPFQRESIEKMKKTITKEVLLDPSEAAPYRDIPTQLAHICKRLLSPNPDERHQTLSELTQDIEHYLIGYPEWDLIQQLNIHNKNDWEFQENILLAKHVALSHKTNLMEWVAMMIAKTPIIGNTKINIEVCLDENSKGIGLLLVPSVTRQKNILEKGYCLWVGSEIDKGCKLLYEMVEVTKQPDTYLKKGVWYLLSIEKLDGHLRFFINNELKLIYTSHALLPEIRVGLFSKDAHFSIRNFKILAGSQNVMINCLAVPDALLAHGLFSKALLEYRKIGQSFPGRAEGREALFRSGLTMIEAANHAKSQLDRKRLLFNALEEFAKIRQTPGAPMEYLGKALVYKALDETEEEIKCLELALRKYPKHPLLDDLIKHITFRLHETSSKSRNDAYRFALLVIRTCPSILSSPDSQNLIQIMNEYCEAPYFLETCQHDQNYLLLAIKLAFYLNKPITLLEIAEENKDPCIVKNSLYALLEINKAKWVEQYLMKMDKELYSDLLFVLKHRNQGIPKKIIDTRSFSYLTRRAIDNNKIKDAPDTIKKFDFLNIWITLLKKDAKAAEKLISDKSDTIFKGCLLCLNKGKKAAVTYLTKNIDSTKPCSDNLLSQYLAGKIKIHDKWWRNEAFSYERITLLRQAILFHTCSKEAQKVLSLHKLLLKEQKSVNKYF